MPGPAPYSVGRPRFHNFNAFAAKLTKLHESATNIAMPLIRFLKEAVQPTPSAEDAEGMQYGAIPYKIVDGHPVFLMVTSRRSANWVFPKGSPIKGLKPVETAAQEAWEEAGVRGEVAGKPVGYYLHPRNNQPDLLDRIQLFPMLVTEQHDDWPEEAQRFRHWALLPQVQRLMASRHAARVAADFAHGLRRS